MNDSLPDSALAMLRRAGLAAESETPRATALPGGVSSDIWRVELARGPVCVKRALPRLRVAQLWEAPIERNRYERLWLETARRAVPGSAPQILASDAAAGLFAMACVDYPLWKDELREGRADPAFAAQVGASLAGIHAATAGREDLARLFATDEIFYAIRLEPYLVATGRKHADLISTLTSLVDRTSNTKVALVHGDVSPKNILVGPQGPVFLDAECAWYGDPAFDLAFCLNHLLLKCAWVPAAKARFLDCFEALSGSYLKRFSPDGLEARTASLLPALLLARVDGKSPVEYLREEQKDPVRRTAKGLFHANRLGDIREAWQKSSM
ncbi:MAG: phosphotransferase family protein [Betaproteobacteria bacterium]